MPDSDALYSRLLDEIMTIEAIDVHSHVPAHQPFARSLRQILGYHYYTELAHSAGMARDVIAPEAPDNEVIPHLLEAMQHISNTVQYSWLTELARELFDFGEERLTPDNWQKLDETVRARAEQPDREREILRLAHIQKVFLTNSFDEDLGAIDTDIFVPTLRADNLVFGLSDRQVRESLERVSETEIRDPESLTESLESVFRRFVGHGALSVAIGLPPHFRTFPVAHADFDRLLDKALWDGHLEAGEAAALHAAVFFSLAELCRQFELPMQVMCGALRGAYAHGVPQGMDLPQAGDTLAGLLPAFNAFPQVTFCVSVLSGSQAQELASYGWILHNVVLSGHWWYLNVPAYIERDLAARLQSVPRTKLIGYYSDMYRLEFGLAKFNMYRRTLARVLARDFVGAGLGTEPDAIELARLLLHDNAARIFRL